MPIEQDINEHDFVRVRYMVYIIFCQNILETIISFILNSQGQISSQVSLFWIGESRFKSNIFNMLIYIFQYGQNGITVTSDFN